jgi:predicted ATPase
LASKLKLTGHNVIVIDELARECPLPINKDASELTQYWILTAQMKREIETFCKYDFIISDRSVIDTLAYSVTLGITSFDFGNKVMGNYVKKYYKDIFLLDPIGFNYHTPDGVRDMDNTFRMEVHDNLKKLYDNFGINYLYMKDELMLSDKLKTLYGI